MCGSGVRRGWAPWAAMGAAALFALAWQLGFVVTYPLNHASGDAPNYVSMVAQRASNLTHASFYPFLMVPWLAGLAIPRRGPDYGVPGAHDWVLVLQWALAQHLLHWLLAVAAMLLLRRALGLGVALAVFLLMTLPPFVLSNVGTTQPEWLQAGLILLSLALALNALRAKTGRGKLALHAGAVVVMGLAWLVKYNTLPLFGALALILLLADRGSWRARLGGAALGAAVAVGVAQAYLVFFHAPSTGTRAWHHNHAWVFLGRLEVGVDNRILETHPAGIEVQRWRALSRLIPQEYQWARAFRTVEDRAPPDQRAPHEATFARVMAASPEELDRIIRDNPLPPNFKLGVSMIPVMWYVGLPEADALGGAVFREWVTHHPEMFARNVAARVLAFSMLREGRPWVPTRGDEMGLQTQAWHPFAFRTLVPPASNYHERYWSLHAALWEPGVRVFSLAHRAFQGLFPEHLLLAAAALSLLLPRRCGGWEREERGALFALLAAGAAFVVAANTALFFRDKEAVAFWPVASLVWAMGGWALVRVVAAGTRAARGGGVTAPRGAPP